MIGNKPGRESLRSHLPGFCIEWDHTDCTMCDECESEGSSVPRIPDFPPELLARHRNWLPPAGGLRKRVPPLPPQLHPRRARLVPASAGTRSRPCRAVAGGAGGDPPRGLLRPFGREPHYADARIVRDGRSAGSVSGSVGPSQLPPSGGGGAVRRAGPERLRRRPPQHAVLPHSRPDRPLVCGLGTVAGGGLRCFPGRLSRTRRLPAGGSNARRAGRPRRAGGRCRTGYGDE